MFGTVTLPAGKYYIGDPCYAFDESWGNILDETDFFNKEGATIGMFPVFAASTAHGDGAYYDQDRCEYPVDAGMIGAMPLECLLLDNKLTEEKIVNEKFGRIIEFEGPFSCYSEKGTIVIGHIEIETDPQEEDEDY